MIVFENLYVSDTILKAKEFVLSGPNIQLIRFSSIENPSAWLQEKSVNPNAAPFCIYFDSNPSQENIDWLTRLSFLPAYVKKPGHIRCFASEGYKEAVHHALTAQGYITEVISLDTLQEFSIGPVQGMVYQPATAGLPDIIITAITDGKYGEAAGIMDRHFHNRDAITREIKQVVTENNKIKATLEKTETQLANNRRYLEIALKEKETEKILDFYHKQYEVLPLWYKRIGHVIKIITGHRKIREKN